MPLLVFLKKCSNLFDVLFLNNLFKKYQLNFVKSYKKHPKKQQLLSIFKTPQKITELEPYCKKKSEENVLNYLFFYYKFDLIFVEVRLHQLI